MASYTVTEVVSSRLWEKDGKRVNYYDVRVEGQEKLVNLGRKPENELNVGDTLEGTLEENGNKLKFRKASPNWSGGGGLSEEEKQGIRRQHSQEMAVRYLAASGHTPELTGEYLNRDFKRLIDWFEADIKRSIDA